MEPKKTVAVFGAGVAGLTAAHELVIRGFDVTVYDPAINHVVGDRTNDRGIGGMARSQFVVDDESPREDGEIAHLRPATDFLRDATLELAVDDKGEASLIEARPSDVLQRFKGIVDELVARKRLGMLRIYLPFPKESARVEPVHDPRLRFLANAVKGAATLAELAEKCTTVTVMEMPHANMVFFGTRFRVLPAEHGFRFFPSFYRHLFDTMRRTPLLQPRPHELGRRSVYENLVSVEALGFARANNSTSFLLPRRPPTSFEEFRLNLRKVLGELDWSGEDLNRFGLKLFEYMTTCTERRAAEYENMSWADFVELRSYSTVMQEHLEFGPQMMASLRGSESDARTQGTIVAQLLLDQLREGTRPDSTLSGPTSGFWFDHWHDYLDQQGVRFVRAAVTDFVAGGDGRPVPVLDNNEPVPADYVVLALPLEAMAEVAKKLKRVAAELATTTHDLDAVMSFLGDHRTVGRPTPEGPLRHMSGIQFYFDTEVNFWRGHTQYLDSEWGLTSIAQPQFWSRPRDKTDAYRSILSVDIGIWDRETRPDREERRREIQKGSNPVTASKCDPKRLAREVWAQIEDHHNESFAAAYGKDAQFPYPRSFALDAGLRFDAQGVDCNEYLFVVNRTGAFARRPGKLATSEPKAAAHYELIAKRFVLAGTHMKTYTRITSMESANESARHAVNAILNHTNAACDRCEIWDPEDHELPDLQWLKDLDRQLFERGLPHFVKILGWSELPALFLPAVDKALLVKGISVK